MEQTFPDVGEGLTEGVLAKWLVRIGETIAKDQMIARVSTDKSVVDIPSSVEGTITELIGEEGDTINVGDVILRTDTDGSAASVAPHTSEPAQPAPAVPAPPSAPVTPPRAAITQEAASEPEEAVDEPEELADASHVSPTRRMAAQVPQSERYEKPARNDAHAHTRAARSSSQDVHALPKVRHYAREHHVDLATIHGTGPDGRITINDLSGASHEEASARTAHAVSTPRVRSEIIAPPSVRRYARERGVDIETISGSGEHGRITRDDVERASAPEPSAPTRSTPSEPVRSAPSEASRPKDAGVAGGREKLTPIRRIIAERMMSSHLNTAAVTHTDRADITKTVQVRQKWKTHAHEHGVNLTYLPFFIKASVAALKAYPRFNASIDGDEIVMHDEYHIGIAVDTERGLVVPVIRHADRKSIIELAREIAELAAAAREGTLKADQMQGSTFTITSVGNFGGEAFTPIINEPNSAILGIGAIKKMPHVYKGEIAVRDVVIYSLTYDHRIVDGADAARFVSRLVMLTEEPEHLFLEGI